MVFLLLSMSGKMYAQDSTLVAVRDSVVKYLPDTTKSFGKTMAQTFGLEPYPADKKPRIAFIRSLFLPGWGQITNRDYWKVGLVYSGAAAGWYFGIHQNNLRYQKFLSFYEKSTFISRSWVFTTATPSTDAILSGAANYVSNNKNADIYYARDAEGQYYTLVKKSTKSDSYPLGYYTAVPANINDTDVIGPFSNQTFQSAKNQYRRWRDASYIGFAAGWLIFALEANVSAHLKTFDMSDNISFKIAPAGVETFGLGASGMKLTLAFK